MAVATTAFDRSADNSTLGVDAIYSMLPKKKASSPGRDVWEATPSGRAGGERAVVAPAAVDVAERAMARHALSTARDASRAAALAYSRVHPRGVGVHHHGVGVPHADVWSHLHHRALSRPEQFQTSSPRGRHGRPGSGSTGNTNRTKMGNTTSARDSSLTDRTIEGRSRLQ